LKGYATAEEIKEKGYNLTARNPNRKGEKLPPPIEIVAGLMEKERAILSIVKKLDETLGDGRM
jgi:type I restriction enzyme M protein